MKQEIEIQLLSGAELPEYRTSLSTGFDLKVHSFQKLFKGKKEVDLSVTNQNGMKDGYIMLRPFERVLVGTGIKMKIPEGFMLQILNKPGSALTSGLSVMSAPVEPQFEGEIYIIVHNSCQFLSKVKLGDKVALGVLTKYEVAEFKVL